MPTRRGFLQALGSIGLVAAIPNLPRAQEDRFTFTPETAEALRQGNLKGLFVRDNYPAGWTGEIVLNDKVSIAEMLRIDGAVYTVICVENGVLLDRPLENCVSWGTNIGVLNG